MKKLLIMFLILGIVYMYNKVIQLHKDLFLGNGIHIDKVSSDYANSIPPCNIATPKLKGKFTYGFWMYIKDYYFNSEFNCWKHIFHKGTDMEHKDFLAYKYDEWDSLTTEIEDQSVGLWLSPLQNDLRVAFSLDNNNNSIVKMGYIDIVNVPIKELFHIVISINNNFIEIYLNGNLHKSQQFEENIVFNKKALFFSNHHTYRGVMKNFVYLPMLLTFDKLKYLIKNKPSI